jgi:hypothetical protein
MLSTSCLTPRACFGNVSNFMTTLRGKEVSLVTAFTLDCIGWPVRTRVVLGA